MMIKAPAHIEVAGPVIFLAGPTPLGPTAWHDRAIALLAQTTRFELAEWKERTARDGNHMVVGIEEGFTGARYIRRRFAQDCPRVPLCTTLDETCRVAAVLCAREPRSSPAA